MTTHRQVDYPVACQGLGFVMERQPLALIVDMLDVGEIDRRKGKIVKAEQHGWGISETERLVEEYHSTVVRRRTTTLCHDKP